MTASSELPDRWVDILSIVGGDLKPAPMTTDRAMDIAAPTSGVRRIKLRLAVEGLTPVPAELNLLADGHKLMAPVDFRWIAFDLPEELEAHHAHWLRLTKAQGLVWSFTDRVRSRRLYGSPSNWSEARGALPGASRWRPGVRSRRLRRGGWLGRARLGMGLLVAERPRSGAAAVD